VNHKALAAVNGFGQLFPLNNASRFDAYGYFAGFSRLNCRYLQAALFVQTEIDFYRCVGR
jgi:hypothetical protein